MSAEFVLVFYGIRQEVAQGEIGLLEERTHPLQVAAREHKIDFYWGKFDPSRARHFLFLGSKIGILGVENLSEVKLTDQQFAETIARTKSRLESIGRNDPPSLYLQWAPD